MQEQQSMLLVWGRFTVICRMCHAIWFEPYLCYCWWAYIEQNTFLSWEVVCKQPDCVDIDLNPNYIRLWKTGGLWSWAKSCYVFEQTTNSPTQYVLPLLQCWPISAKLIVRSNYCDGSSPVDGRCWFLFAQDRIMNISFQSNFGGFVNWRRLQQDQKEHTVT